MSPVSNSSAVTTAVAGPIPANRFANTTVAAFPGGYAELLYKIRPGDTLSQLAKSFGTNVATLARLNAIQDPYKIRLGDQLLLPLSFHVVQPGESFSSIARLTGVNFRQLQALNPRFTTSKLLPNDVVTVPAVFQTGQEQVFVRLVKIAQDYAAGREATLFGPGTSSADTFGNKVTVTGVAHSDVQMQFSDDFRFMRLHFGELDFPESAVSVRNPVTDYRNAMAKEALADLGWAVAEVKDPNSTVSAVTKKPSGELAVTLTIRGKDLELRYNPTNFALRRSDTGATTNVGPTLKGLLVQGAKFAGVTTPIFTP